MDRKAENYTSKLNSMKSNLAKDFRDEKDRKARLAEFEAQRLFRMNGKKEHVSEVASKKLSRDGAFRK